MTLSIEEQRRVDAAIKTAELRTDGEIVCVIARSSSDYLTYAVAWSALIALASPWPLIAATQLTVQQILLVQVFAFAALYLALSSSGLRHRLAPRRVRRAEAHRAAMEQFMIRGMAKKQNRAGVLIFVSLAEHYVRIVADDGIAAKVDQSVWRGAVDTLLFHIRNGDMASGFISAVEQCGGVLAQHFPASGAADELPDKIYVI
ncbi:TPM domain-containing protein [Methylocella sp.]|jgi:putative membrane protein|uniref:TPM domain-containing protein n=1 Tax=Methylocella sp. TaxID=1978226 RepID=UPI003C162AEF